MYYVREGYKWIRLVAIPDASTNINTGTLNMQVRLFGNPPTGDASRSYTSGVPWKSSDVLVPVNTSSGAATTLYDYKLPQGAHGFYLNTNIQGVSGASTIVSEIFTKDPVSGQLQALGAGLVTIGHATGYVQIQVNPGYGSPYPIATPPAGTIIYDQAVGQDLVIQDAITGTGSVTFSQSAAPIQ